jgi:hypothetical protein
MSEVAGALDQNVQYQVTVGKKTFETRTQKKSGKDQMEMTEEAENYL